MRVLIVGGLLTLCAGATVPARQAVRRTTHDGGRTATPGPLLVAARKVEDPTEGGWAAAGGLAALAVASEVVQYANTALLVLLLRRLTHTASMADLAEVVIAWFRSLGLLAYPVYVAMLCSMQVLPLFSALIFIVLSGAVFGAAKGTAVVSFSLTAAAVTCCGIGRLVAKRIGYDLSKISPPAAAIDKVMSEQQPGTSLLLVLLIRLSPVVPFTFSNYLFGAPDAASRARQGTVAEHRPCTASIAAVTPRLPRSRHTRPAGPCLRSPPTPSHCRPDVRLAANAGLCDSPRHPAVAGGLRHRRGPRPTGAQWPALRASGGAHRGLAGDGRRGGDRRQGGADDARQDGFRLQRDEAEARPPAGLISSDSHLSVERARMSPTPRRAAVFARARACPLRVSGVCAGSRRPDARPGDLPRPVALAGHSYSSVAAARRQREHRDSEVDAGWQPSIRGGWGVSGVCSRLEGG